MTEKKKYFPPKCDYIVDGNHFVTDGSVRNKVSGTTMAGILSVSPWKTPFQAACELLGLCKEDISSKPAVKAGQVLEEPIIRYAGKRYKQIGLFMTAEEVYQKREGDHDSWVSDFDDDIFAGHVDGIVMTDDGKDYILEVKTSINYDSWVDGVPVYYYWQVALYNEFIAKQDKAYVLLGMVTNDTYKDHRSWVPNDKNVGMFEMQIDREDVRQKMEAIREWYAKYIMNGITPDYDPNNPGDVEMFERLKSLTEDVNAMAVLTDQYYDADRKIAKLEEENKVLYNFRDAAKERLRQYMDAHRLTEIISRKGFVAVRLSESYRTSLDEDAMIEDGIDLEKYKIRKHVKKFTTKIIRNDKTKDGE